jgi:hydroxymethylpyrimidine pyrophosphatase-like HAD family hydrolase
MIVADLDDSLLGSDLRISAANKKALLTAADKGIFVTIATGRMFKSALPFIRELSLNIPVITYQGALIKNAESQETLLKKTIPQHYAVEIIRECRRKNIYLQVYLEDEYFFNACLSRWVSFPFIQTLPFLFILLYQFMLQMLISANYDSTAWSKSDLSHNGIWAIQFLNRVYFYFPNISFEKTIFFRNKNEKKPKLWYGISG